MDDILARFSLIHSDTRDILSPLGPPPSEICWKYKLCSIPGLPRKLEKLSKAPQSMDSTYYSWQCRGIWRPAHNESEKGNCKKKVYNWSEKVRISGKIRQKVQRFGTKRYRPSQEKTSGSWLRAGLWNFLISSKYDFVTAVWKRLP